jgi:hypothetical protein
MLAAIALDPPLKIAQVTLNYGDSAFNPAESRAQLNAP